MKLLHLFGICMFICGTFFPTLILAKKSANARENLDDNYNIEDVENDKDVRGSYDGTHRKKKFFSVFQVVTFANAVCMGSNSRNGTCYTMAECTSKGGSSSGSTCASGYGVCCVFSLSCGGTTSQNCSYLVQASTTKAPTTDPCTYTICRCSTNICRIRLDFTILNIAMPTLGTTAAAGVAITSNGGAIGDCTTDSFSLTSPGNTGSPVICGFNNGQHMIVDASDECSIANFDIGSTGDTRQWDIKVTQYACGDTQGLGGPPGCLQYFTGTTGRVSSYNFPTMASTIGATTTHLSSQCYTICFRQEMGQCSICYTTSITNLAASNVIDTETAQTSFGLSLSPAASAIANSGADIDCSTDYLVIPNAAPIGGNANSNGVNRICGRNFFAAIGNNVAGQSVCSFVRPFQISFKSNNDEVTGTATAMANLNEQSVAPGGIVGFSLNYVEQPCPALAG